MSFIVLAIGSLNQCFVNKVNELNESVLMDVDRVVVVKARDDMAQIFHSVLGKRALGLLNQELVFFQKCKHLLKQRNMFIQ